MVIYRNIFLQISDNAFVHELGDVLCLLLGEVGREEDFFVLLVEQVDALEPDVVQAVGEEVALDVEAKVWVHGSKVALPGDFAFGLFGEDVAEHFLKFHEAGSGYVVGDGEGFLSGVQAGDADFKAAVVEGVELDEETGVHEQRI